MTMNREDLYTCRIVIHRASNVPVSDLHNMSCDPYFHLTMYTKYVRDSSQMEPQHLTYRTHTVRRTLNPEFNFQWIVSGIPASGFTMVMRLMDEDPGNYDDKLGKAILGFPSGMHTNSAFTEGWEIRDKEYKIHKRRGSVRTGISTMFAKVTSSGAVGHRTRVWVSVVVLGKAEDQSIKRLYTIGPHRYVQHFSPVIGRYLGASKAPVETDPASSAKASTFMASRLQLTGPVPDSLRHRYVGFAPFVKAMFKKKGIEGIILSRALHKQHMSIYKWDKHTVWGVVGDEYSEARGGDKKEDIHVKEDATSSGVDQYAKPNADTERHNPNAASVALARQFLKMASHGTHGRIFTYVILLDGEWRFTQTGDDISVDLLSKHTMHSDVAVEIAFSGEFFVRPIKEHRHHHHHEQDESPTSEDVDEDESPPQDPSAYELIIDNDSGTYRPRKDLLPTLRAFLSSSSNLLALGRVAAMDGFDEKLKGWKEERRKHMKVVSGGGKATRIMQTRASFSSSSSSSSSSASSVSIGGGRFGETATTDAVEGKVTKGDVEAALEEDAKRATDNADTDRPAIEEEQHKLES